MQNTNLFYKYYDVIFGTKDYKTEVDIFLSIAGRYYSNPIKKILEIGCGTGNHTVELAKNHIASITAIDIDKNMTDNAIKKINLGGYQNVNIQNCDIERLKIKEFDMVMAGFNVVTYISNPQALISFFTSVYECLNPGGIFIFDCWNGIAAIKDPPTSKYFSQKFEDGEIECSLSSQTNFFTQKTRLSYDIKVVNKVSKTTQKDSFSFDQTLWTPMEINYFLESSGLKIIQCCKNLQIDQPAEETDWKIMYVCQKQV